MQETLLNHLPKGVKANVLRCLSPSRNDSYRLLEMGLCRGVECVVLHKNKGIKMLEIGILNSRLCINDELASQFMVVIA